MTDQQTDIGKREQVALQCDAVAYLAESLAGIRRDYARLVRGDYVDDLLETIGANTAREMELLGDLLNAMDAVTEEDAWLSPVFETAHRLWPDVHD